MPGGYHIRTFIAWLRLSVRTTVFRSYTSLLAFLLRLIRSYQVFVGGKERTFREPGLAFSSHPADQEKKTHGTLAVPLLKAPPQSEWPNPLASNNLSLPTKPIPSVPSTPSSSYPATPGQFFDITLTPIMPGQIKRYERNQFQDHNSEDFEIQKGPLDCSEELAPVSGWEPLTHPEGALFFYHSSDRVFTDVDVRDPGTAVTMGTMGEVVKQAYKEARKADTFHASIELTLERMEVDGQEKWGYYFADHDRRVIFWLEPHNPRDLLNNVRGVKRKSHVSEFIPSDIHPSFSHCVTPRVCTRITVLVRTASESLPPIVTHYHYLDRMHIELFPNKRFLPEDVLVGLKEIVMFTQADSITSEKCLAPYASDEVSSMLDLMDPLTSSVDKEHEHSVWIVARFMGDFCGDKFANFCGQPGARLDADQSLYNDTIPRPKSILFRVMNVILFGSPDAQSKALHKIWVDYTIVHRRWKFFINRLNNEWNGYTIFSTVMLAVDISFLAVPPAQNQAPAIIVLYISILCALGSLVVSLVLAGQVNDSRRDSAKGVASFMEEMSRSTLGLESLALMLSLPYALLIWGMAFFAAALSIVIYRTSDVVTISIISPIWTAIFILSTWPVLAANNIHVSHLSSWIAEQVLYSRSWWVATRSHS
ncbi:hypothetical protein DFJ58DRAFT_859591 [Suillus subalutaceus]|uniref:uncharacterized protein n=1 Tax=Suillus subalutaceus TaxID=48586 RepID=UPI001B871AD8|nr:uncharacterized protein DFJ58DRAFT_859591 [Suillus subalutaceus]KAG1839305.1 hypothetical protein DFJ58DRAFT_859591 [Suillus subalutaceus]